MDLDMIEKGAGQTQTRPDQTPGYHLDTVSA